MKDITYRCNLCRDSIVPPEGTIVNVYSLEFFGVGKEPKLETELSKREHHICTPCVNGIRKYFGDI